MSNVQVLINHNKTLSYLLIIAIIGIIIRLYYYPYDLVFTHDAFETYFLYAIDIKQLGHLPLTWTPANNLWPAFLGIIFQLFPINEDILFLMDIQRSISIFFSIITLIPIYFLCKKFNDNRLAIIGGAFFIFDPRIIQNSLLGITESLYLFLAISSIVLILLDSRKAFYLSFVVASLVTLVRGEGIIVLILISIIYFIKFKNNKKRLFEYVILVGIFILVLLPMITYRIDVGGSDGIFFRISNSISNNSNVIIESESSIQKIVNSIENYLKYLGWILIPNFILFVPIGIIMILRNRNYQTFFILLATVILSIPALAIYSNSILETRYLYILFPIFALIALVPIKKLISKNNKLKPVYFIIIIGLILGSIGYLEFKKIDYDYEKEVFESTKDPIREIKIVNQFYGSKYVNIHNLIEQWPILSDKLENKKILSTDNYITLEKFIEENKHIGLSHIVVDQEDQQTEFIKNITLDESKYPYLIKEYDSVEHGFSYNMKIYRINYDEFTDK